MSFKVTVYIPSPAGLVRDRANQLFFKRPIRRTPNGLLGVVYKSKVHPLYKGSFIDPHAPEVFLKIDCPIVEEETLATELSKLPELEDEFKKSEERLSNFVDANWQDEPGLELLKFESGWWLDLREYYSYVVFKGDEKFFLNAKKLLGNPNDYLLHENAGWMSIMEKDGPEVLYRTHSPAGFENSSHRTFFDRWGDHDYECRESHLPAANGVSYDYWFRFSPDTDEVLLKGMFEEVFTICAVAKIRDNGLDYFSEISSEESLESTDTSKDNEIENLKKEISRLSEKMEEIIQASSSEEDGLLEDLIQREDEIKSLNEDKQILELEITDLQSKLDNSKEVEQNLKEKMDRELKRIMDLYLPEVYFLEKRTLKSLSEDYQALRPVLKTAKSVTNSQHRFKKVKGTKQWMEVDKKISNGIDNQGRLYYCKVKDDVYSFSMLISHKSNQKNDFAYLQKNDPPTFGEL